MALTESKMMTLGTEAPDFVLPDTVSGRNVHLAEIRSDLATVIMFICNHCPFVIHVRDQLAKLADDYLPKGISFVAISANDVEDFPEDGPDKMRIMAQETGFQFPYLYDESQSVARAYGAACTPDIFVFDGDLKCVYRGQLDDSRPGNQVPVTGRDVRAALDALLSGGPVNPEQKPSIGCNIKWKSD